MSVHHVPARDLPVPSSISPEAQAFLGMGSAIEVTTTWPALDDADGWRKLIAERDELMIPFVVAAADGIEATHEQRDVDGVTVHVVTPDGVDDDRVVLDLHGGALIFLGGEGCKAMSAITAEKTRLPTWGVDYRMPPDHPYPAGLDDCVTAYRALLDERPAARVVLSGGSAGGNLAAAVVLRARDEGLALPSAVVLETPEVDLTESGDSFRANLGVDRVLGSLLPVNELYAAGEDLTHPYLSPLFGDLTGFPPTILTTGTRDLFLSNTVRMHRALRRAGVEAELHVLEAASHGGFMGMAPEDAELTHEIRRFIERRCPAA